MSAAGDALAALFRGDEETDDIVAAARLMAETFSLSRQHVTSGKVK